MSATENRRYVALAALAIVVGVGLQLPTLGSGLAADDYLQRAMLDGTYPVTRGALDLYAFVSDERDLEIMTASGALPWWSDPELRLSALRPLASLLCVFDHRVLGGNPLFSHAHSLAWMALAIVGFALIARRLLPTRTAALSVFVFAIDPMFLLPVGWLANRTALVSTALGLLALHAHLRHREDGWRPGAALSVLGFSLALAAGEYALSVLAYLLVYEIFAAPGSRARRAIGALHGLLPAAVYLVAHIGLGYGAKGSAIYVDPIETPAKFALALFMRVPSMLASELSGFPPDGLHAAAFALGGAGWLGLYAALGALAWLATGSIRRLPGRSPRLVGSFAIGAVLSTLPLAGTLPSVRLLVVPAIGGSLVVAALFRDAWLGLAARRGIARVWLRAFATLPLAAIHLAVAPIASLGGAIGWYHLHAGIRRMYLNAQIDDRAVAGQTLVLLNAVETTSVTLPPFVRAAHGRPVPKAWRVLSITHHDQRLTRVAPDTLELDVDGSGMLENPVSQLYRGLEHPLVPGHRVSLPGLSVEVLQAGTWGPKRVRYRFDRSLDDPSIVVLIQKDDAIRRFTVPPVGGESTIPAR